MNKPNDNISENLVVRGRHEVLETLKSGKTIDSLIISKGSYADIINEIIQTARAKKIKIQFLESEAFRKKFGGNSQGVIAQTGSFSYADLNEIIEKTNATDNAIIIAVNNVEDPRNLGAITRTAEAGGAAAILIPTHRAAGMTEWAVRTAQGASDYIPIARVTNIGTTLESLKAQGFWIIGLDEKSQKKYWEVKYSGKLVLVAGGEDAGLGRRVASVCDETVAIPMSGHIRSLNVSVSVGIVFFEMLRQSNYVSA